MSVLILSPVGAGALLIVLFVTCFSDIDLIPRIVLITTAIIVFIIGMFFAMKLEREVGYYECNKCSL